MKNKEFIEDVTPIEERVNLESIEKTNIENYTKRELFTHLILSGKLPKHIKTIEDALTISQMGQELGFKLMQAFHYIVPIEGKLSLSAKAIGALLKRNGISYTTLEDAVFIFSDGTISDIRIKDGVDILDRRTTIKFTREGVDEIVSYTWTDAKKQELTEKSNWRKMPKEMLYARCLAKGANRVAPDKLLGLYTTEEMVDTFIQEDRVKRNENGEVIEIN